MSFRIVCSGELLPGFDRAQVQHNLLEQLRVTPMQADALLSGRAVVLKRGLDAAAVAAYMERLTRAGLSVRAEPDAVEVVAEAMPAAAEQAPAIADEIECPRCHEKQPRRTLCRSCALDIPRYLAAQKEIESDREAERIARLAPEKPQRAYPLYQRNEYDTQPALFGLSFEGRIGRRAFLFAGCLQSAVACGITAAALGLFGLGAGLVLGLLLVLVSLFWGMRVAALRCHDVGWPGWCCVLIFVPLVNLVFYLLLLFMPGQADDNDWGAPSHPRGWMAVVAGIVLMLAAAQFLQVQLFRQAPEFMAELASQGEEGEIDNDFEYDASANKVVMYSLTTCGFCVEKRAALKAEGIRFSEYFLDEDEAKWQELQGKLRAIGYQGGVGTPSFEINGELVLNNPPMSRIRAMLRKKPADQS